MTRIPDDHTAARELERRFRELGAERAAAARPRRTRLSRRALLAGAAALTAVAAAVAVALPGSDDPTPGTIPYSTAVTPSSGYRASDPTGGTPWAVQGFTASSGDRCARVEFVSTEAFSGSLAVRRAFAAGRATTCLSEDSTAQVRVVSRNVSTRSGQRSVIFGVVAPGVDSVRLEQDGESKRILVARRGVFLLVRAGGDRFDQAAVVASGAMGSARIAL